MGKSVAAVEIKISAEHCAAGGAARKMSRDVQGGEIVATINLAVW